MYLSDLGSNPLIIDDGNADKYVDQWRQEGLVCGMTPRDYRAAPFGSASRPVYQYQYESDRNKLRDRIKRADENKATPDDWRIAGGVPVLDQNGYGLCWCYGTVGAMMTTYAMAGQFPPHLSAAGPAFQGKNWRDEGGWGEEALRYIERFGVPELSVWPEHSRDRSLPSKPEVQESAAKHKVTQSLELPRNDINALISVLTDPVWPRPVTVGFTWWGHLVYAVRAGYKDGQFLVKIVNSWKPTWGEQGCAWLAENKAKASEQIAIQRVSPLVQAA